MLHFLRIHPQWKRRCGGVLIALGVLFVVIIWAQQVTPYKPTSETDFYQQASGDRANYYRAEVVTTANEGSIKVRLLDGPEKDSSVSVEPISSTSVRSLHRGSSIILYKPSNDNTYSMVNSNHFPVVATVICLFILLAIAISGRRGVGSLIGLGVSMIVLFFFIAPLVLAGHDTLLICVAGAYIIAIVSVFIAHGLRRRTIISVLCICFILAVTLGLAMLASWLAGISGISDENTFYLSESAKRIDMRGLFIGGIIIATLSSLDDIVTTQVATVSELRRAQPKLTMQQLYQRAFLVGKEHMAGLVNTLVLAYAGASLPILIQISRQSAYSGFLFFNDDYIAEEIIRTLLASIGLLLAVPISTAVAVFGYTHLLYWKHDKKSNRVRS